MLRVCSLFFSGRNTTSKPFLSDLFIKKSPAIIRQRIAAVCAWAKDKKFSSPEDMQPTAYEILKTRLSTEGIIEVRIHRFRRGTAEVLLKTGAGLPEVMQTGRWKSSRMVSVYTANLDAESGAVA